MGGEFCMTIIEKDKYTEAVADEGKKIEYDGILCSRIAVPHNFDFSLLKEVDYDETDVEDVS